MSLKNRKTNYYNDDFTKISSYIDSLFFYMLKKNGYKIFAMTVDVPRNIQKKRIIKRIANAYVKSNGNFFKLYNKTVYENHPEKIDHKQIHKHGVKILKVPN